MFYSVDLLTLRRNGKFTKCWLAANMSPRNFHNKFRRHTIAAIDVTKTCEEFIEYVNTDGPATRRFSLYLSAQLMFGLTRIFYYQVDACLKENLKLWIDINASRIPRFGDGVRKKKSKKLPDLLANQIELPPPEPPASVYPLPHLVDNEAMITLQEPEIALHEYEWMMRNADENFGALTAEQMDAWLDPNALFGSSPSSSVRAFPKRNSDDTLHIFKIPQSSPQRVSRQAIVDVGQVIGEDSNLDQIPALVETVGDLDSTSAIQPRDEITRTPIKHKLSPTVGVGTPSKKPRGPEAEDDGKSSNGIMLESLDSSVLRTQSTKKKPRKLIRDKEEDMKLPFKERPVIPRKNWKIPRKLFVRESADKLLTTPSTRLGWGKTLRVAFDMMLVEPISEPFNVGEAVRVPADVSEQSKEFSTLTSDILPKSTTSVNVSGDRTKTDEQDSVQKSLVVQKLPPLVDAGPEAVASSFSHVEAIPELTFEDSPLPAVGEPQQPPLDITRVPKNAREVIGDWVPGIRPPCSSNASSSSVRTPINTNDSRQANGADPQSSCTGKNWVKADVHGTLQVHWSENQVVTFKDICHPSFCTKKDASQLFVLLLELQESKIVKLVQIGPFANIGIVKY